MIRIVENGIKHVMEHISRDFCHKEKKWHKSLGTHGTILRKVIISYHIQVYLIQVTCGMLGLAGDIYKYEGLERVILTINQESKEEILRGEVLP